MVSINGIKKRNGKAISSIHWLHISPFKENFYAYLVKGISL